MFLFVFVMANGFAQEDTLELLNGKWTVDYDLTIENAKNSPKYSEEMAAKMPEMVKSFMNHMTLEIADAMVIYHMGEKSQEMAFEVDSIDGDTVVLKLIVPDQEVCLTFTLMADQKMNFKSSGSDDMDYYIWHKTEQPVGDRQ